MGGGKKRLQNAPEGGIPFTALAQEERERRFEYGWSGGSSDGFAAEAYYKRARGARRQPDAKNTSCHHARTVRARRAHRPGLLESTDRASGTTAAVLTCIGNTLRAPRRPRGRDDGVPAPSVHEGASAANARARLRRVTTAAPRRRPCGAAGAPLAHPRQRSCRGRRRVVPQRARKRLANACDVRRAPPAAARTPVDGARATPALDAREGGEHGLEQFPGANGRA